MKKFLIAIVSILAYNLSAYAVPALNKPVKVTQPDGTVLTIHVHGDEYLHWTTCGNSLVEKSSDGYWCYASFDADGVSKTMGAHVNADMRGDGKGVVPPKSAIAKAHMQREKMSIGKKRGAEPTSVKKSPISEGQKRFLILLMEFSDKKFTQPKSSFENLLSSSSYTYNGATGSVNKYYKDVSFGQFDPVFDVYGPIPVNYTSAFCADMNNTVYAVIDACQYAHDYLGVDFSKYCNMYPDEVDNVFFFFPGYNQAEGGGSDTIWPHAASFGNPYLILDGKGLYNYGCASEYKGSSGGVMAGIGTFSHEFGHVIGLPDFYDTDYAENEQGNALATLSLMSSGSYNNNGNTPPYFTYEEKHILGWDKGLTPLKEGKNTLLKTSENVTYYNPTPNQGEYYLYESRPTEGWDKYTYCAGMAIYHVDKSDYVMPNGYTAQELWEYGYMINAFASHQCMDLVESVYPESNVRYNEEMVFPGLNNVTRFTSSTLPAAKSWAGVETGYNITDINFNKTSGSTTFNVELEKKITGTVKTISGQGLAGIEISVKFVSSSPSALESSANGLKLLKTGVSPALNAEQYIVTTDTEGKFELVLPKSGMYAVSINKSGYMPYNSNVNVSAVVNMDIILATAVDEAGIALKKYTEVSGMSLGYGENIDHYGGLYYTAQELEQYVGDPINFISFMASSEPGYTCKKMGVQIYFDDVLQLDCEVTPIFNTMNYVDLREYNLKIPKGKEVLFAYYVLSPTYGWTFALADVYSPIYGANLITDNPKEGWYPTEYGNMVISASITHNSAVIDLAGINYIPHKESYLSGESFKLELKTSSVNTPSNVTWTVDGNPASGSIILQKGVHTVKAYLTFLSGRKEIVETKLNVK